MKLKLKYRRGFNMDKNEIISKCKSIDDKDKAILEAVDLTSKAIVNDYADFLKSVILGIGRNKKNHKQVAEDWEKLNNKWK